MRPDKDRGGHPDVSGFSLRRDWRNPSLFLLLSIMTYYLYILYSETTDHYYVGSSSDPEKRVLQHNAGATTSTKPGRPWEIVYSETFSTKTQALKRENYLKRMKSRVYLESIIKNNTSL